MATPSPALADPSRSTPDVAEQRARVRAIVAPHSGERGLDIGCGFGMLACELARDVGPTGRVVGVDSVPTMIAACEERARHDAVTGRTEFRQADAEALPFAPGTFDFVTAMQVYEYMPDVERGLAEASRFWLSRALQMRRPGRGLAGYEAWQLDENDQVNWVSDPGLLTGAAGIALALLAATTALEPEWDRVLMVAVPPFGSEPEA